MKKNPDWYKGKFSFLRRLPGFSSYEYKEGNKPTVEILYLWAFGRRWDLWRVKTH